MCIGSMTFESDAAIPGSVTARRAQLPSEDPVRTTQKSSVPSSSTRTATGSGRAGVSGGGGRRSLTNIGGGGVTSTNLLIPDDDGKIDGGDGDINDRDGGGTKRKIFPGEDDEGGTGGGGLTGEGGGGGGTGGEDDNRIVDDEGDATDDTKDKIKERELEEEGPTTSPARIVSPLIRAVQGERTINRRGRNSLFVKQGRRTGAHRVRDRVVNSSSLRPPQSFVSPIASGLIPTRR